MKIFIRPFSSVSLVIFVTTLVSCFCAGRASGQVLVWGDNSSHQTNVPPSATNVIAMAAGDYHCLALRADGTVVAWGASSYGLTNVPPDLTNAVSVAAGSHHSLALRRDGTVTLWGQIWGGTTTVPPEATNVVALALGPGAHHALVLRADGTVVDWGLDYYGLTNIPPTARNIVSVAVGAIHSVALRSDGRVVAWGDNSDHQTNVPASATNIVAIATGWYGNVALRADGTILTWGVSSPPSQYGFTNIIDLACPFNSIFGGSDILGLRGNGTVTEYSTSVPANATNVAAVAAGSYNGLALVGGGLPVFPGIPANRTVASGATAYLQLMAVGALPLRYQWSCNGTNIPGATNTVLVLTNVQPSQTGTCYTLTATNMFGAATNGPITLNEVPSEVSIQAQTLSALVDATITFTASTIGQGPFSYQWQFNGTNLVDATNTILTVSNAQLADAGAYSILMSNIFGVVTSSVALTVVPTIITNSLQSQSIFPGGTAALSIGVQAIIPVAYQWQFNGTNVEGATNNSLTLTNVQYHQDGIYSVIFSDAFETVTNNAPLSVVPVAAWGHMGQQGVTPGLTNLIAIACGDFHNLALNADGTVIGWGSVTVPPGLTNVISIAAGNNDSLALRGDSTVVAWGDNSFGRTNVPAGLTNIVAIAAGDFHNLVLKSDGAVMAWGNNDYGQTNVPASLTNVVAIAAGEWNSMALKANGTVVAWGAGTNYTSDPHFGQSVVPGNLTNVVQIATGGADDLALKANGSIIGWGGNFYGEDNPLTGLSNIVSIAAGYLHSVVLKADGTVVAWGYNYYGETNVPTGLINVVALSAKGSHNLALIGNGPPVLHAPLSNPKWGTNCFSLSLPTQSGRVYRLEYKNSPTESNWTALPLAAGNGGTLTLTDTTATSSQRFYRVRQW